MLIYVWVAIGGAIGTLGRFVLAGLVASHFGETFPWGTLVINISGSFVIGFFIGFTDGDRGMMVSPEFRTFFTIGICGGYTTFSSYSLQTLRLAQAGQFLAAGGNILASNAICLGAVWLGYVCATLLRR
jgi:CrcB protein